MTSTLQNRLVGTIIVVALVVILVPEFLDGEKRTNKQEFVDIPPVAELVEVEKAEAFDSSEIENQMNQSVELVNEMPVDDDSPQSQAEDTSNQSPPVVNTPDSDVSDNQAAVAVASDTQKELSEIKLKNAGWVVQLGSFKHEKNVKKLLNTLNSAGYRAYSRPVMTPVGELTKVFVGPELDKEKLERALPHLKEITQLKGKITAFEVSTG